MKHWIRNLVILVVALGLLVGGTKWYQSRNGAAHETFRTVTVGFEILTIWNSIGR